jgi:hypothetical protein
VAACLGRVVGCESLLDLRRDELSQAPGLRPLDLSRDTMVVSVTVLSAGWPLSATERLRPQSGDDGRRTGSWSIPPRGGVPVEARHGTAVKRKRRHGHEHDARDETAKAGPHSVQRFTSGQETS